MPRRGRKTIDQPESLVKTFQAIYDKNSEELEIKEGITDFQGFMTKLLSTLLLTGSPPEGWKKYLDASRDELFDGINRSQQG